MMTQHLEEPMMTPRVTKQVEQSIASSCAVLREKRTVENGAENAVLDELRARLEGELAKLDRMLADPVTSLGQVACASEELQKLLDKYQARESPSNQAPSGSPADALAGARPTDPNGEQTSGAPTGRPEMGSSPALSDSGALGVSVKEPLFEDCYVTHASCLDPAVEREIEGEHPFVRCGVRTLLYGLDMSDPMARHRSEMPPAEECGHDARVLAILSGILAARSRAA